MKFKFKTLALTCKQADKVIIDFSPRLSLFYGKMSSGKSTIARLIDYCLGGDLERTPALASELVSVQLSAMIGKYDVIFERKAFGSNQIQATWRDSTGEYASVLAPTDAGQAPIWGNNVFNLSDLIFHLVGIDPLKIPKSVNQEEMVRLSFRDVMWYCYLEQNHLDSSFYWLTYPFKERKSRYVLNFVVGAYSERLNELYNELAETKELKIKRKDEVENLTSFLKQFGYSSENEMLDQMFDEEQKLKMANDKIQKVKQGHSSDTHFVDDLRDQLRELEKQVSNQDQVLIDISTKISEQISLRAEFIGTKFKLVRSKSARNILESVSFDFCPSCGSRILESNTSNRCPLCKQDPLELADAKLPNEDAVRLDLDSRIYELEDSIRRLTEAQNVQKRVFEQIRDKKVDLDRRLDEALAEYDSKFLSSARELERQVASSIERINNLKKMVRLPQAVANKEKELEVFSATEQRLKTEIQHEEEKMVNPDKLIQEIETAYLECLKAIKLPGINQDDRVEINRTTWIPYILPHGFEEGKWDFFNAGSGGKKTILNVCYALAIHKVATEYNLPLPNFLIIDSPMKNVGKGVNKEIFEAFYNYLYELAQGPLSNTQFVIIETDYVSPPEGIDKKVRLMNPNDKENPPLIPYYSGP